MFWTYSSNQRVSLTCLYYGHPAATAVSIAIFSLFNPSEAPEHFQREREQDPLAPKYGTPKLHPPAWSDLCSGATRLILVCMFRSMAGRGPERSQMF